MKGKFLCSIIILLVASIFTFSYTFAANDNSMLENAANGIRNTVNDAGNVIEDAARGISNTSKNITQGIENAGNNIGNTVSNTMDRITADENTNSDNNTNEAMEMTNNAMMNEYTAERTATGTTNAEGTFLGITTTTWIWLVIALAAIGIGILVYSYFNQTRRYSHSDEE